VVKYHALYEIRISVTYRVFPSTIPSTSFHDLIVEKRAATPERMFTFVVEGSCAGVQ
jgi:hypothetical protein